MAKKETDESVETEALAPSAPFPTQPTLMENTTAPRDALESGPMADLPPTQIAPPSDAQYAWFAQNPSYVRISHSLGSYTHRGTLSGDGTFTPEGPGSPVLDGNGSFGVGIPAT